MFTKPIPPSFLIIGAEKAGTTFLFNYLNGHPDIASPANKEITFFNKDFFYQKGIDWYHAQFPKSWRSRKKSYEASPGYLYYPWVAERIFRYNRDIKLVVLLREPVSRAYSAWNMHRQLMQGRADFLSAMQRTQNESIRDAVRDYYQSTEFGDFEKLCHKLIAQYQSLPEQLEPGLLKRGIYHEQIERYVSIFPKNQLLVLESAALRRETQTNVDLLCDFVGIARHKMNSTPNNKMAHARNYEAPISESAQQLLADFYRPHNQKLYELLNTKFDW